MVCRNKYDVLTVGLLYVCRLHILLPCTLVVSSLCTLKGVNIGGINTLITSSVFTIL